MDFPPPEALAGTLQAGAAAPRSLLARGGSAVLASLSQAGCAPFPPGVPGFQPHGFLFRAPPAFWGSVPTTALLRYLRQAAEATRASLPPSKVAGPVVLHRGSSFREAALPMVPRGAFGPGHRAILAMWRVTSRCPVTEDSSTMPPQRCFQDYIASDTEGCQEAPMRRFLALLLWLNQLPLSSVS